jgi:hypothetical protein
MKYDRCLFKTRWDYISASLPRQEFLASGTRIGADKKELAASCGVVIREPWETE